jgi:hypothetical protein
MSKSESEVARNTPKSGVHHIVLARRQSVRPPERPRAFGWAARNGGVFAATEWSVLR